MQAQLVRYLGRVHGVGQVLEGGERREEGGGVGEGPQINSSGRLAQVVAQETAVLVCWRRRAERRPAARPLPASSSAPPEPRSPARGRCCPLQRSNLQGSRGGLGHLNDSKYSQYGHGKFSTKQERQYGKILINDMYSCFSSILESL